MFVFLHVPKTAGQTLISIIEDQHTARWSVFKQDAWNPKDAAPGRAFRVRLSARAFSACRAAQVPHFAWLNNGLWTAAKGCTFGMAKAFGARPKP